MATSPICSIPDCGKPVAARGWCNAHYRRWRRHGDPLGGSTTRGEPRDFLENIALKHLGDDCLIWPYNRSSAGYPYVTIDGEYVLATRYICEKINGAPPTSGHQAAHSCGKGHLGCISPLHLSWKTYSENQADRIVHGTDCRGEAHGGAKLTEQQVREIRTLADTLSQRVIARMFNIDQSTVSDISNRKLWPHVE
jgi:hypothetical protein